MSSTIATFGQLGALGGAMWECHGPKDVNGTKQSQTFMKTTPAGNVKKIIEAAKTSHKT